MATSTGYFLHRNNPFCEGVYWGYSDVFGSNSLTELGNTLSNIAYVVCGIIASHASLNSDPLVKMQCALLILTGVGSALYHATFFYGFGLFDGIPMLVLISITLLALLDDMVMEYLRYLRWVKLEKALSMFCYTLVMAFMLFALQQNAVFDSIIGFDILFALPIIAIVLLIGFSFLHEMSLSKEEASPSRAAPAPHHIVEMPAAGYHSAYPSLAPSPVHQSVLGDEVMMVCDIDPHDPVNAYLASKSLLSDSEADKKTLKRIAAQGVISMLIAFAFHLIDGEGCNERTVYIIPHVWWHVFSAYAGLCIIAFSSYVRSNTYHSRGELRWLILSKGYHVFPVCSWKTLTGLGAPRLRCRPLSAANRFDAANPAHVDKRVHHVQVNERQAA